MGIDLIRSRRNGGEIYGIDNFCCGKTSLGSLFAKGKYGEGKEIVDIGMEKVRS